MKRKRIFAGTVSCEVQELGGMPYVTITLEQPDGKGMVVATIAASIKQESNKDLYDEFIHASIELVRRTISEGVGDSRASESDVEVVKIEDEESSTH